MASRPPPRYVVRPHDAASQRRLMLWLGLAWLGSVLLVGVIVALAVGAWKGVVPRISDRHELRTLTAENEDLKQQVANIQRSQQVNDIATKALRETISQRDEEISGLRADLSFYSRLVGGDAQREGLKVQEVSLQSVPHSQAAWNLAISLTQNIKRDDDTNGTTTISVEGLRNNKVVQLDWSTLGDAAEKNGIPFKFRYFQQLHTTIALPSDFRPTRLHVTVQPENGDPVSRTVAWSDALSSPVTTNQGDTTDAQP
jgi:cell division protein FtsB